MFTLISSEDKKLLFICGKQLLIVHFKGAIQIKRDTFPHTNLRKMLFEDSYAMKSLMHKKLSIFKSLVLFYQPRLLTFWSIKVSKAEKDL